MNISLFGLGYVGAVIATCLAELGRRVMGVEVSRAMVDMINEGRHRSSSWNCKTGSVAWFRMEDCAPRRAPKLRSFRAVSP